MNFFDVLQLYMQDLLRQISVWALWPVMLLLIIGAVYALWCIVSVLIEYFMQRRHFKENVPQFVDSIEACGIQDVEPLIEESGMLVSQKDAMLEVAKRMKMEPADLYAVANREISLCKEQYSRVLGRTEIAAKVAPMLGLMGTLIPLGPGIVAMGQGNTEVLSASLLIAFDTTVAGLIIAGIATVVSKVRKGWYTKYHAALEACMTALLQKAQAYRESLEEHPELAEVRIVDESKRMGPYLRKEVEIPLGPHADGIDVNMEGLDVMVTDPGVEAAKGGYAGVFGPKPVVQNRAQEEKTEVPVSAERSPRCAGSPLRGMPSRAFDPTLSMNPAPEAGPVPGREAVAEVPVVADADATQALPVVEEVATEAVSAPEDAHVHDAEEAPMPEIAADATGEELAQGADADALIEEAEQIVADSAEAAAAEVSAATDAPAEESETETAAPAEAGSSTGDAEEDRKDKPDGHKDEPEGHKAEQGRREAVSDGSISLDDLLSAIGTEGR